MRCSHRRSYQPQADNVSLRVQNNAFPPSLVLQHGPLRIGVIHGHQAVPLGDSESLAAIARTIDVDVLVNGGTHRSVLDLL